MATSIWIGLLAWAAPALADDPPDAAVAWAAVFDQKLPQYKNISLQYSEPASVAPGCAMESGCEALEMVQWSLLVSLEPQDQRRFSPAKIRIHPLGDLTPAAWIASLEELAATPGQVSVAGIAAGSYWVEMAIPCTLSNLLPYEASDLVKHIKDQQPDLSIHSQLAWSPCAQKRYESKSLEWVEIEAKVEREQWGIMLPQGRVVTEMPD